MLPDCLSHLFQDASPEERRDEPKYMNKSDDFIPPVITRSVTCASLKAADRRPSAELTTESSARDIDRPHAVDEPRAQCDPDDDSVCVAGRPYKRHANGRR